MSDVDPAYSDSIYCIPMSWSSLIDGRLWTKYPVPEDYLKKKKKEAQEAPSC